MDVTSCPENMIIVNWQNRSLYFRKKTGQLGQVQFRVLQSRNDWFRYCCAIAIIQDSNTRDCQTNAWLGVGDELAGEILNRFRWKLGLGVRTSYWKHHFPRGEEANYKYTKTWIVDDVGAKTHARATEVFCTLSDRYILGEPEEEPNGLHRFWSVEFVNTDEEFSQFKQAVLELPGAASHAEDSSSLVDEVIHYLKNLADECARLPSYFPAHLHFDGSGETPFDELRQTVQLVTDRHRLDEWLAKQRDQKVRQGLDPDSMAYGPRRGLPEQEGEYEGTPEIEILDWDDRSSRRFKRAVILGDPGFGKTWLLRYEARRLALEAVTELEDGKSIEAIRLPIFCRLSDLAPFDRPLQDGILEFLCHEHGHQTNKETLWWFVGETLLTDHCVLLLDAWDEVPQKLRLQKRVEAFARRFSQPSILLTSRIVGYEPKLAPLANTKGLEIVAFDWPKIRAFVQVWFGRQRKLAKTFLSKLEKDRQMRGLARIPLMLSLMCRAYPEGTFPRCRSELYEACLKGLMRDWVLYDRKSGVKEVELDGAYMEILLKRLGMLSLELFQQNLEQFSSLQLVEILDRWYEEREVVELIPLLKRRGILVAANSSADSPFLFLHLTFQEYLAARGLARQSDYLYVAMKHLYHPAWKQVLILLGGALNDPKPYIAALLRANREDLLCRPLLLATSVVAESVRRHWPKRFLDSLVHVLIGIYLQKSCVFLTPEIAGVMKKLPEAAEALITLVQSSNDKDRFWAIQGIREMGSEKAIGVLVQVLRENKDRTFRTEASEALGSIGSEQAVQALVEALDDQSESVRSNATYALGSIGSEKAVPALIAAMKSPDENVRGLAVGALGSISSEEAVQTLIEALKDQDKCVRSNAVRALGVIGSEEALQGLIEILKDADKSFRRRAVGALGSIGSERAIQAVIEALKDRDEDVRHDAVRALGSIGSEQAVPYLIQALRMDRDIRVRRCAAEALGSIGSEQAVQDLIKALKDPDRCVCAIAAEALRSIGSEQAVQDLTRVLKDKNGYLVVRAAEALASTRPELAEQALIEKLEDQDSTVRFVSTKMLGSIGSERAVQALINVLNDQDELVRTYAAEALGSIGSEQAVQALINGLNDQSGNVRSIAAEALGVIGSERAVQALIDVLDGQDELVRTYAAEALGSIGSEQAVQALVEALDDEDEDVCRGAVQALRAISKHKGISPSGRKLPAKIGRDLCSLTESLDHLAELLDEAEYH